MNNNEDKNLRNQPATLTDPYTSRQRELDFLPTVPEESTSDSYRQSLQQLDREQLLECVESIYDQSYDYLKEVDARNQELTERNKLLNERNKVLAEQNTCLMDEKELLSEIEKERRLSLSPVITMKSRSDFEWRTSGSSLSSPFEEEFKASIPTQTSTSNWQQIVYNIGFWIGFVFVILNLSKASKWIWIAARKHRSKKSSHLSV